MEMKNGTRDAAAPIQVRDGRREDAAAIAALVAEAMSAECCRHYHGARHTLDAFVAMLAELAAREDTQYSFRNTLCATDAAGRVVGICVCYDGGDLLRLRRPFISEVLARFGRDFSCMPAETEAGEVYVDSLAVVDDMRGRGIARMLMDAAEQRGRARGIPCVGLLVDRANPRAERLYVRWGFSYVGDRDWGGHTLKHLQKRL